MMSNNKTHTSHLKCQPIITYHFSLEIAASLSNWTERLTSSLLQAAVVHMFWLTVKCMMWFTCLSLAAFAQPPAHAIPALLPLTHSVCLGKRLRVFSQWWGVLGWSIWAMAGLSLLGWIAPSSLDWTFRGSSGIITRAVISLVSGHRSSSPCRIARRGFVRTWSRACRLMLLWPERWLKKTIQHAVSASVIRRTRSSSPVVTARSAVPVQTPSLGPPRYALFAELTSLTLRAWWFDFHF